MAVVDKGKMGTFVTISDPTTACGAIFQNLIEQYVLVRFQYQI
jgi:hypothetical protein